MPGSTLSLGRLDVIPCDRLHVLPVQFQVQSLASCFRICEVIGEEIDTPPHSIVGVIGDKSKGGANWQT
jgi:hypothetical protein